MTACEPCWNEAFRQSHLLGGSQVDHYLRLIAAIDCHNDPVRPEGIEPPTTPV